MSYSNWFHSYFKSKHKDSSKKELLEDVFALLEARGSEYLKHNNETYHDLYIKPDEDILSSKPQIIQQVRAELYSFLELLIDNNVKTVLQIGLGHFGSTHFCISLICDKVVSVEYDMKNIKNYADREILYNQNKEVFIYGDSSNDNTINEVSNLGKFDCVFVDGNHSYEYVKKDYNNYLPSLKDGGIFAFHDALLEGSRYGTPKVLKEIGAENDVQMINHSKEVGIAYFKKKS